MIALLLLAGCAERLAVPEGTAVAESPTAWIALLKNAVDERGLVDYARIEKERAVLDSFLAWVAENGPLTEAWQEAAENKRLAFMINAHNAAAFFAVITKHPERSVRDIQVGIWRTPGAGFAHGLEFRVDGAWRTLDKLENELTIMRYQEPRAHFAMVLAARGGPVPRYVAFEGVNEALDDATDSFVQSDRALRPTDGGWAASELFFLYEKDLLEWGDAENLCSWLVPHAAGEAQDWLVEHVRDCPLASFPMDWTLDAQ